MTFTTNIIQSILSIFIVASHIWAARYHFNSTQMRLGAILISLLVVGTTFLFTYLIWTGTREPLVQIVGMLLEAAGFLLFLGALRASREAQLLAAFSDDNPHSLVRAGPYKYVRHPFYTSYILFWGGWTLALWSPLATIPLISLVSLYIWAARIEENKFSRTAMSEEYADYRARTGFFWPRLSI